MTQTLGVVETARQIVDGMIELVTRLSEWLPLSPLGTFIGITCVSFQITLSLALSKKAGIVPEGPWSELSLFTAHQLVSFLLMVMLTYFGFAGWFFGSEVHSATDRIFGTTADNTNDLLLAIGSGAILLWDIPTGFASPPLRDVVMWLHHIGMFLVASTMAGAYCEGNQTVGRYYAPFFFGVIECSSVFLSFMDIFHPKFVHYYNWLNSMDESRRTKKILHNCNEMCRVAFAITYLIFRGAYFPYVAFRGVIPDLQEAYQSTPDTVPAWTGQFLITAVSLFALLQAYWGLLITKALVKAIRGGGSSGKKED